MKRFSTDCRFLTGPTGVGKSEISLALAQRLDAEIIAMDSMTLYRGMDIGTAKPTAADRSAVPHHLLDLLEPSESASLDWYLHRAEEACGAIRSRGRIPLFVGGTPLYLKACLRGIFEGPDANAALRARLEREAEEHGTESLHERLRGVDPVAAERILPGDLRRIVRALEVFESTGQPISRLQRQFAQPASPPPPVACLMRPRAELYRRIDERVTRMFAAGLIDEVRALLEREPPPGREAAQAVGVSEIAAHLRGELGYDEMVESIRCRTRRFCKRQLAWFRGLEECVPFEIREDEELGDLLDRLERFHR